MKISSKNNANAGIAKPLQAIKIKDIKWKKKEL